jgi:hypothetical protein
MNKLLKEWRIVTIVTVVMAVFASCSVGDDADSPDANMKDSYNAISKEVFLYEGPDFGDASPCSRVRLLV